MTEPEQFPGLPRANVDRREEWPRSAMPERFPCQGMCQRRLTVDRLCEGGAFCLLCCAAFHEADIDCRFWRREQEVLYGDGTGTPLALINTTPATPSRTFTPETVEHIKQQLERSSECILHRVVVRSERERAMLKRFCPDGPLEHGPLGLLGVPIVTDETMPPGVLELRNRNGLVLARIEDFK